MPTPEIDYFRTQLQERKRRIEIASSEGARTAELGHLLEEVDAALVRIEQGTFGICESCHDSIEKARLLGDPLVRFCVDHLTADQQRQLQADLELAARIQRGLLPKTGVPVDGWEVQYRYEPVGAVSGDYCDLIASEEGNGDFVFLLGDVSGKGVAASMLMTHLHAMFRSLVRVGLPVDQLLALANRLFCESAISGQYATLVCGKAARSGAVELCNAGHLPALVVRQGGVTPVAATGLPLGMFCESRYTVEKLQLAPGDLLFLFTDGVSELRNGASGEFGVSRLARFLEGRHGVSPQALTAACLEELRQFSKGAPHADDLTLMAIRRAA